MLIWANLYQYWPFPYRRDAWYKNDHTQQGILCPCLVGIIHVSRVCVCFPCLTIHCIDPNPLAVVISLADRLGRWHGLLHHPCTRECLSVFLAILYRGWRSVLFVECAGMCSEFRCILFSSEKYFVILRVTATLWAPRLFVRQVVGVISCLPHAYLVIVSEQELLPHHLISNVRV